MIISYNKIEENAYNLYLFDYKLNKNIVVKTSIDDKKFYPVHKIYFMNNKELFSNYFKRAKIILRKEKIEKIQLKL